MMDVRQGIEKGENSSEVENKINSALSTIDRAAVFLFSGIYNASGRTGSIFDHCTYLGSHT